MTVTGELCPNHYEGPGLSGCIHHKYETGEWWNILNVHHIAIDMTESTFGKKSPVRRIVDSRIENTKGIAEMRRAAGFLVFGNK